MKIQTVTGDLVTANVDLIVQQCNCLTVRSHGLSDHISKHLGANPYRKRTGLYGNLAVKQDRGKVGTVSIYTRKNTQPYHVACLFAQFTPGKPGMYYQDVCKEHGIVDDYSNRVGWFKQCLGRLTKRIEKLGCKTVAFPLGIGCGLAGGDWKVYIKIITDWAEEHKDKFRVIFMKK